MRRACLPFPRWKMTHDRRWRLDNLYKIASKDGTETSFRMNLVQKALYLDGE